MKRTRKTWVHTIGQRPYKVVVRERRPGGPIYCGTWDPTLRGGQGDTRWKSLKHRDRDAAKAYAAELHAGLLSGEEDGRVRRITLGQLLAAYLTHRSPHKKPRTQKGDKRLADMFIRHFGKAKDASKIMRREWDDFIRLRRLGVIDARGNPVAEEMRRPVRDRRIEADLRWFLAVLNWGTGWQDREGRYLLRENCCRGYEVPKERNPLRPIATRDRVEALQAMADAVTWEMRVGGKRKAVRSTFGELLALAVETGRRLSAVLSLRCSDLHLERTAVAPHGAITWRSDSDKAGVEWKRVQINAAARATIDQLLRERPAIGDAWLFPAPGNLEEHVSRHLADKLLRRGEKLAGLEPQKGSAWHAFRRMAATEFKGLPEKDVMRLLGWTDPRSLKSCYEHADTASTLAALEQRRELRGVAG